MSLYIHSSTRDRTPNPYLLQSRQNMYTLKQQRLPESKWKIKCQLWIPSFPSTPSCNTPGLQLMHHLAKKKEGRIWSTPAPRQSKVQLYFSRSLLLSPSFWTFPSLFEFHNNFLSYNAGGPDGISKLSFEVFTVLPHFYPRLLMFFCYYRRLEI